VAATDLIPDRHVLHMNPPASSVEIRIAEHAAAIAAIHNQGIGDRGATFDTDPVTADDGLAWLGDDRAPVLVAELDGRAIGWARVQRPAAPPPGHPASTTRADPPL
jgi:hypothetical protein